MCVSVGMRARSMGRMQQGKLQAGEYETMSSVPMQCYIATSSLVFLRAKFKFGASTNSQVAPSPSPSH